MVGGIEPDRVREVLHGLLKLPCREGRVALRLFQSVSNAQRVITRTVAVPLDYQRTPLKRRTLVRMHGFFASSTQVTVQHVSVVLRPEAVGSSYDTVVEQTIALSYLSSVCHNRYSEVEAPCQKARKMKFSGCGCEGESGC